MDCDGLVLSRNGEVFPNDEFESMNFDFICSEFGGGNEMGLFDKLKKKEITEKLQTHNLGGCIITRSLLEKKSQLKWIFREQSCNVLDNGWRAIGDSDTQEYINIAENNVVVDFDRLVEI